MATYEDLEAVRVNVVHGVAWITIDHPPINLLDAKLLGELSRLVERVEDDPAIRVLVFQSADPDFFIAHADVEMILNFPDSSATAATEPNPFVGLMERIRRMPKISIGMISGIARGGGSEFLLSLDMRFAARTKARLSQPEAALGIIPGGGGTQRLAQLVGRGRALEIVLGCGDVDAAHPATTHGFVAETNLFNQALAHPEARNSMEAFLQAGGQTREMELRLGSRIAALSRQPLVRAAHAKRAS